MRSFIPLTLLAVVGVASSLRAQQVDDYALRFNGQNDFVAMPQTSTATNSFTMEFWAKPSVEHEIDVESLAGYAGIEGQRYAVFPSHGTHCWGDGHAGAGVSIGTNGVSVYEHAGEYIPAVLVHKQDIEGWTHIAVVYNDRRPYLYINGVLVRVGSVSPQKFVHPSTGDAHRQGRMGSGVGGGYYGWFEGDLDNVRMWSRAIVSDAVPSLLRGAAATSDLIMSLDMNRAGSGRGLLVENRAASTVAENTLEYKTSARLASAARLVTTYGTDRTPVFVPRASMNETGVHPSLTEVQVVSNPVSAQYGDCLGGPVSYGSHADCGGRRAELSTPIEPTTTPTATLMNAADPKLD